MIQISAKEARAKFSEIIDQSQHEAISLARHDRVVSVIISKQDFDRLKQIEDEWWMSQVSTPSKDASGEILQAIKDVKNGKYIRDPLV